MSQENAKVNEEPKKEEPKKEEPKKEETKKEEEPWYCDTRVKMAACVVAGVGAGMLLQKTLFGGCDVTIVSGDSNGLGLW